MFHSRMILAALFIFVVLVPVTQAQNEKIYKGMTPAELETVLLELKVEFKKVSPKKGDEHFYDFTRGSFNIRLTHYSREEIMLDCVFRGAPLEKVNQWNTTTRVCRVRHDKDGKSDFTILEYGLDTAGGITAGTIKQYLARFDDELKKYDRFIGNAIDDVILAEVNDAKLEEVLKTMGVTHEKKVGADKVTMFDFELVGQKIRLYNFGGKDLMMDVHYKKVSLEDVNRYNLNRKFVRTVNYRGKDIEYTALEANFDCVAGVTEGMIRHWIVSFGEDARHFNEFTKKINEGAKK